MIFEISGSFDWNGINGFGKTKEYGLNLFPFPPASITALFIIFLLIGIIINVIIYNIFLMKKILFKLIFYFYKL